MNTGNVRAVLNGGGGNDVLTTGSGTIPGFSFGGEPPLIGDEIYGGAGNDIIRSGDGNDTVSGGGGGDAINAGAGDDLILFDPANDGADFVNTGLGGNDTVRFDGFTTGQIRLTFVSAEVGNGNVIGSANGDGSLAVRVQREDSAGNLTGGVTRVDDEGVTFIEGTQGYTFDVRDLVSGAQRGDQFTGVVLGTSGSDALSFFPPFRASQPFYYNGGQGNDTITAGDGADFLVGGAGNDRAFGNGGNDSFIGGGGVDIMMGGAGNDTVAAFNPLTDGADQVNLGFGDDVVNVTAPSGTNVRLSFVSAEVGNGSSLTSDLSTFAVRLQAETDGTPGGDLSGFDDEGITFVGGAGVTFDVRDFVSGAQRGEAFEVVRLGDSSSETLTSDLFRPYYINGGGGDDDIFGNTGNDFLVGGAGNDLLQGGLGDDTFIGGGGADIIEGGDGTDVLIGSAGADFLVGGAGADSFRFDAVGDSGAGGLDIIGDFVSGTDSLDLTRLRSGASDVVTLQAFETYTLVSVDQGNDGSSEFTVQVNGTVTATDYVF